MPVIGNQQPFNAFANEHMASQQSPLGGNLAQQEFGNFTPAPASVPMTGGGGFAGPPPQLSGLPMQPPMPSGNELSGLPFMPEQTQPQLSSLPFIPDVQMPAGAMPAQLPAQVQPQISGLPFIPPSPYRGSGLIPQSSNRPMNGGLFGMRRGGMF